MDVGLPFKLAKMISVRINREKILNKVNYKQKTVPEERTTLPRRRSSRHPNDLEYTCNPKQLVVDFTIKINSTPKTLREAKTANYREDLKKTKATYLRRSMVLNSKIGPV